MMNGYFVPALLIFSAVLIPLAQAHDGTETAAAPSWCDIIEAEGDICEGGTPCQPASACLPEVCRPATDCLPPLCGGTAADCVPEVCKPATDCLPPLCGGTAADCVDDICPGGYQACLEEVCGILQARAAAPRTTTAHADAVDAYWDHVEKFLDATVPHWRVSLGTSAATPCTPTVCGGDALDCVPDVCNGQPAAACIEDACQNTLKAGDAYLCSGDVCPDGSLTCLVPDVCDGQPAAACIEEACQNTVKENQAHLCGGDACPDGSLTCLVPDVCNGQAAADCVEERCESVLSASMEYLCGGDVCPDGSLTCHVPDVCNGQAAADCVEERCESLLSASTEHVCSGKVCPDGSLTCHVPDPCPGQTTADCAKDRCDATVSSGDCAPAVECYETKCWSECYLDGLTCQQYNAEEFSWAGGYCQHDPNNLRGLGMWLDRHGVSTHEIAFEVCEDDGRYKTLTQVVVDDIVDALEGYAPPTSELGDYVPTIQARMSHGTGSVHPYCKGFDPNNPGDLDGDGISTSSDLDDDCDGLADAIEFVSTTQESVKSAQNTWDTDGDLVIDGHDINPNKAGAPTLTLQLTKVFTPKGVVKEPCCTKAKRPDPYLQTIRVDFGETEAAITVKAPAGFSHGDHIDDIENRDLRGVDAIAIPIEHEDVWKLARSGTNPAVRVHFRLYDHDTGNDDDRIFREPRLMDLAQIADSTLNHGVGLVYKVTDGGSAHLMVDAKLPLDPCALIAAGKAPLNPHTSTDLVTLSDITGCR